MRAKWWLVATGCAPVLLVLACGSPRTDQTELDETAAVEQAAAEMPMAAPDAAAPPQTRPPVTVRGGETADVPRRPRKVKVAAEPGQDSVFTGPAQSRHPSPLFLDPPDSLPNHVFLRVGDAPPGHENGQAGPGHGRNWTVGMALSAADEGNLIRIHVDGPTPRRAGGGIPNGYVVTGFYDAIASDAALLGQRYSCVRCGPIKVCGVEPICD